MTNMLKTIEPKSDQLNFDDFVGGKTLTIKITKVSAVAGDQPIAINFEGDNGKPWKPCKSMRRVLVHVWKEDGAIYVGRSLTLYGDPTVRFGKDQVGGIRISHMSNIAEAVTMALTATKAQRKPFTVKPLAASGTPTAAADPNIKKIGDEMAAQGVAAYTEWLGKLTPEVKGTLRPYHTAWTATAKESDKNKIAVNVAIDGDGYPADTGEGDAETE